MYEIKNITLKEIGSLKEVSEKEGLLFPKKPPLFIGAYYKDKLVGFGGFVLKKNSAVIKCDYVIKEFRKKGVATKINKTRLQILKVIGYSNVEANATKLAVGFHINCGAKVIKKYKNGITKVAYENK